MVAVEWFCMKKATTRRQSGPSEAQRRALNCSGKAGDGVCGAAEL